MRRNLVVAALLVLFISALVALGCSGTNNVTGSSEDASAAVTETQGDLGGGSTEDPPCFTIHPETGDTIYCDDVSGGGSGGGEDGIGPDDPPCFSIDPVTGDTIFCNGSDGDNGDFDNDPGEGGGGGNSGGDDPPCFTIDPETGDTVFCQ